MKESRTEQKAREIYETIMRWLEEGGQASVPASGRDILVIPIPRAPETPYNLRFRRMATLGQGSYAQSLERSDIKIKYDPNWNILGKIEELIGLAGE
jgi:hypothetical protein